MRNTWRPKRTCSWLLNGHSRQWGKSPGMVLISHTCRDGPLCKNRERCSWWPNEKAEEISATGQLPCDMLKGEQGLACDPQAEVQQIFSPKMNICCYVALKKIKLFSRKTQQTFFKGFKWDIYCFDFTSLVILQDILENESINLDWMFRYSLINDVVKVCISQTSKILEPNIN